MKKFTICIFVILISLLLNSAQIRAQSLSLQSISLEEFYRREQLLGNVDQNLSFVIRPLTSQSLKEYGDIYRPDLRKILDYSSLIQSGVNHLKIQLLPVEMVQQYNSHHPEYFNDGAMIPARGLQSYVSIGIYAEYGPLQIQFKPEFIYAENTDFMGFQHYYGLYGYNPRYYFRPTSSIDFPERFGEKSFNKFYWGQSSVKLTFKDISFGLSTENLWWGPGMRNTLLMTNAAPGFTHLTLNTAKPIKTKIGSFEGQIISGRLEASGYTENLPDDWRYINAMIISYQPKWVPGFFIGAIRSFQIYNEDIGNGISDYLPIFSTLVKKRAGGGNDESGLNDEDRKRRDQLISIFMRWLWQESHAEIYFEYGRNDYSWDIRDLTLQLPHSSAYMLGFTKLIPLASQTQKAISINFELTQLEAGAITINRNAGSWYQHGQVVHGYTHEGQLLGASIGPGSNLQTLSISWVNSLKTVGLQIERYVHNNDFWYHNIKDVRMNWVDISAAVNSNWDYKNFIMSIQLKFVKSMNYQWLYSPKVGDPQIVFWEGEGNDFFNFHARIGVMYRF